MPRRKYGSKTYSHYIDGFYVFTAICFIVYQILSSIFSYMPLMLGFFFCYMYCLLQERDKSLYDLDFRWYFSVFYILFIDITHDFYLFSSLFAFLCFHYFFADWLKVNFKIGKLLPIVFVVCAYALLIFFDNLLSYLDNKKLSIFSLNYLLFILCIESFLSYIFFKDKIK
ncbi:hypothetical protein [Campylobacter avium]|uniref:hypothetical protein n=1 Tax=Campylobacter avium TaxID=522485 RepID=UPI002352A943|nr:hypothetical protein [Campylobacter avium]